MSDPGVPTSTPVSTQSPAGTCGAKKTPTVATLVTDQTGTTTLEWAMLMAAIALPSWFLLTLALNALTSYYGMMTTLNDLPFP